MMNCRTDCADQLPPGPGELPGLLFDMILSKSIPIWCFRAASSSTNNRLSVVWNVGDCFFIIIVVIPLIGEAGKLDRVEQRGKTLNGRAVQGQADELVELRLDHREAADEGELLGGQIGHFCVTT